MNVDEYVINIGKNSKFYGRVGRIIHIDSFSVHVKYEDFIATGRHPAAILRKCYTYFDDDLFTMK